MEVRQQEKDEEEAAKKKTTTNAGHEGRVGIWGIWGYGVVIIFSRLCVLRVSTSVPFIIAAIVYCAYSGL